MYNVIILLFVLLNQATTLWKLSVIVILYRHGQCEGSACAYNCFSVVQAVVLFVLLTLTAMQCCCLS